LSTVHRSVAGAPGGADSVLCAEPALDADHASIAAPDFLPYPPEPLEVAWRDQLAARQEFGDIDSYRYDLVDVTRQVLSNRARVLLPLLRTAFLSGDLARFESLRNSFMELFDILEPVLATRREFLLGPWLADARSWGEDDAEADALEFDARTLITTWSDTTQRSPLLYDYGNREWAGLLGDFHRPRWNTYLDSLADSLRSGEPPVAIDFATQAVRWTRRHDRFATEPDGDCVAAAMGVHYAVTYFEGLP
ncbi:MAG: alpha-N-acetylglucosaminidase C-terminal domain-containing protein, partial [Stackebrandtia sp.]